MLREHLTQVLDVGPRRLRRRTLAPGERAGKAHDHLDHLVLGDELHQLVQVGPRRLVAIERNEGGREGPGGIGEGDADAHGADVDPQTPGRASSVVASRHG